MGQLPCACATENDKLDEHPPDDARVGRLGLVTEFGLAFLSRVT